MSMMDPDLRQQWAENDEKKRKAEFAKEYAEREAKWKAANAKTGAASRAISPADASDGSAIPDLVYDVVNEMLREGKRPTAPRRQPTKWPRSHVALDFRRRRQNLGSQPHG